MEITSLNSKLIQKCLLHAKQVAHSLLGVFGGIRKVIKNGIRTKEDCSYNIVKIPQKAMIKVLCSLLIDPGINVYGQALHYFSKCILVNSIFYNKAPSYVCFK